MSSNLPKLFGIIGVPYQEDRTFYIKRSLKMHNYPGVWSLPSIQFEPHDLPNLKDLSGVQNYFDRISRERLGGVPTVAKEFLTAGDSDVNPIGRHVYLYLYRMEMLGEPRLNPDFYTDMKWMTAAQFERASAGQPCGLCTRLWSDYAWMRGITDRPFVAREKDENVPALARLLDLARAFSSRILSMVHAT